MGWLLLCVGLLGGSIVGLVYGDSKQYNGLCILCLVSTCIALIVSLVLLGEMLPPSSATIETINKEYILYTNASSNWDEMDYKEKSVLVDAIEAYNYRITEHGEKLDKFMVKGLYSKNIANLPLIEVREE